MLDHSLRLDPIYAVYGEAVTLSLADGGEVAVTVIDKTSGVTVPIGKGYEIESVRPVACVRLAELAAQEIAPEQLPNATLPLDGKVWRVEAHRVNAGEAIMILIEEPQ
jgi:hypothetical protein